MNKKAIIPSPYMLLFYKRKYGDITRKKFMLLQYIIRKIHVISNFQYAKI